MIGNTNKPNYTTMKKSILASFIIPGLLLLTTTTHAQNPEAKKELQPIPGKSAAISKTGPVAPAGFPAQQQALKVPETPKPVVPGGSFKAAETKDLSTAKIKFEQEEKMAAPSTGSAENKKEQL